MSIGRLKPGHQRAVRRVRTHGFTVIELLICVAIVGLLISLLSGGVQSAREAARRTQCMSHQRELGLGIQSHLSKLRYIPSNGGYDGKSTVESPSGQQVTIGTFSRHFGLQFWWGVGQPGADPKTQTGSWAYAILPSIEQGQAYSRIKVESAGPLFRCPSRSRDDPMVPADDDHGRYTAAGRVWAKTDYAGNERVMRERPDALLPNAIIDGMSQTLATGEKAFDPLVQTASSWYFDEPIFSGGSHGTVRKGLLILRDGPGIKFAGNWGSPHPGGAVFTRLDGSVEFLSASIDGFLFRSLLAPADSADPLLD
ncbi:MAG: DUF1559 domain-containing protein [Phycisphaera sp. RhM]|nr:DUF1559 domain-containing protein [Phycisphaera sp. RhM]